jgi:SulP family sulfate permease
MDQPPKSLREPPLDPRRKSRQALYHLFPFLRWFERYNLRVLRADITAGLTVAFVLIPQSMAYAQLAGLPAYYGLYAAFLPPFIASLFGSSNQLATGPVAVVSLMTATALEPLAIAGSEEFIAYAIMLAVLVGVFQFLLGVLRLGVVVNFLSHPVVNGFTNAAALIIATSQLSKLFGVYVDNAEHHYETVYRVLEAAVHYIHWPTLGLAVLAFVIMWGLKRLNPRIPYVLIAVIVTTLISWSTGYQHNRRVSISDIRSPAVERTVAGLDSLSAEILTLTEERAQLSPVKMASLEPDASCYQSCHTPEDFRTDAYGRPLSVPHHPARESELRHRRTLLDFGIRQREESVRAYRKELRSLKFTAVPLHDYGGDKRLTYYIAGQESGHEKTDGRTWRIRLGGGLLIGDTLTMIGGGAVVATIPQGLPRISIPKFDLGVAETLFPMAIIISLLGFMEAISIAKAMAAKTKQRLDANQELIGQGLANMIGAMGQSYPISGSFSRSAVNIQSGAITGMSSLFTSLTVVITLLFFTPLLYHLPQSVLAAVIMMAVIGLVNLKAIIHAWQAQRHDGVIAAVTFVATLAFAPHLDRGIMIGVFLTLGIALFRHMRPTIAILSKHPDGSYRSADRWKLRKCRHIGVIRWYGSLFFASAHHMDEKVTEQIETMPDLKCVLIVGNAINDIDYSGVEVLSGVIDRIRESGCKTCFSGLNDNVLDVMEKTGLVAKIGEENLYRNVNEAVNEIRKSSDFRECDDECPLLDVHYASEEQRRRPSHARIQRRGDEDE